MTIPKEGTAREQILWVLAQEPRRLFATNEIHQIINKEVGKVIPIGRIYTAISTLVKTNEVVRKEGEGGFGYGHAEDITPAPREVKPEVVKAAHSYLDEQLGMEFDPGPAPAPTPEKVEVKVIPAGVKGRKKHVIWDANDRILLATRTAQVKKDKPYLSLHQALEQAVRDALPAHKQKKVRFISDIPWLQPLLAAIAQQQEAPPAQQTVPPPAQPNAAIPAPTLPLGAAQLIGEALKGWVHELVVGILTDPRLVEAWSPKERVENKSKVDIKLPNIDATPINRHNPEPIAEERVRKPKVLVYGINKGNQVTELTSRFQRKLDITFGHTDDPTAMMVNRAKGQDIVILLTDHINHRTRHAIESANVTYELLKGSIGALEHTLFRITRELQNETANQPSQGQSDQGTQRTH